MPVDLETLSGSRIPLEQTKKKRGSYTRKPKAEQPAPEPTNKRIDTLIDYIKTNAEDIIMIALDGEEKRIEIILVGNFEARTFTQLGKQLSPMGHYLVKE